MPLIIPLGIVEVGLAVAAVIHILTHRHFRIGNLWIWLVVSIVVTTIGPILYFAIGRGEADHDESDNDDENLT